MVNHDVIRKFRFSFVHFDFILASRWFVPRVDRECAALIDGSTLRKDCVRAVQEEIVLPSSSQRSAAVVSAASDFFEFTLMFFTPLKINTHFKVHLIIIKTGIGFFVLIKNCYKIVE